jgi:hypothetical protein
MEWKKELKDIVNNRNGLQIVGIFLSFDIKSVRAHQTKTHFQGDWSYNILNLVVIGSFLRYRNEKNHWQNYTTSNVLR